MSSDQQCLHSQWRREQWFGFTVQMSLKHWKGKCLYTQGLFLLLLKEIAVELKGFDWFAPAVQRNEFNNKLRCFLSTFLCCFMLLECRVWLKVKISICKFISSEFQFVFSIYTSIRSTTIIELASDDPHVRKDGFPSVHQQTTLQH